MSEEKKCTILAIAFVAMIFSIIVFGGTEAATTGAGKSILDAICF